MISHYHTPFLDLILLLLLLILLLHIRYLLLLLVDAIFILLAIFSTFIFYYFKISLLSAFHLLSLLQLFTVISSLRYYYYFFHWFDIVINIFCHYYASFLSISMNRYSPPILRYSFLHCFLMITDYCLQAVSRAECFFPSLGFRLSSSADSRCASASLMAFSHATIYYFAAAIISHSNI